MSDEAAAPAASEGLGTASQILASKLAAAKPVEEPAAETTAEPATETPAADAAPAPEAKPAVDPDAERAEHNRRLIAEERAKRQAKREREEAEKAKSEAAKLREEAEAARSEAARIRKEYDEVIATAKRDPAGFLERTGLTLDDVVRAKINGEVSPELLMKDASERTSAETAQLREEIKALREEREAEKRERQENEARSRSEHATRQIKSQIEQTITANPTKYELIAKLGEQDEVYRLIEGRYIQSKGAVILTPEEAANEVEKFHRERLRLAGETSALDELIDALPTEKRQALIQRLSAAASNTAAPAAPGKQPLQAKPTPDARAKQASALTANTVTSPATPAEVAPPLESREAFIKRAAERLRAADKEAEMRKAR